MKKFIKASAGEVEALTEDMSTKIITIQETILNKHLINFESFVESGFMHESDGLEKYDIAALGAIDCGQNIHETLNKRNLKIKDLEAIIFQITKLRYYYQVLIQIAGMEDKHITHLSIWNLIQLEKNNAT